MSKSIARPAQSASPVRGPTAAPPPAGPSVLGHQPRYRQLAQTLINEINGGRYPVGGLLPTEFALCEQFGASRFTVREAIRQLAQMGIVTRRPGVGTHVQAKGAAPAYRQIMSKFGDLHHYTADTTLEITAHSTAQPPIAIAESIGALPGATWLYLEGIRRTGEGVAICSTQIYIHPTFRSLAVNGKQHVPIYTLIEDQFGERVKRVEQDISATTLGIRAARLLQAKARSPALFIVRRYLNARDETIEIALNLHPSRRFSYAESFLHDWQAA